MAKQTNKSPAKKNKGGRPSKFEPKMLEQVTKLCMLGATDQEIADFFDVSVATISNWKIQRPEFLDALKAGKEQADALVAKSLFHRAIGYEHDDVHISNYQGQITITPLIKRYPPDTTAGIFWLKNRRSQNWRDKQEHEHTAGESLKELLRGVDGSSIGPPGGREG